MTVTGVALGVTLVILAVGLVHGFLFAQGQRNAAVTADILFAPPAATFGFGFSASLAATMPAETAAQIKRIEGVSEAVPIFQTLDGDRIIDGIDYDSLTRISAVRVVEGRPALRGQEVIIDRMAQRALHLRAGSQITLLERTFTVAGIYAPESLYRFKVPISTVQELIHRPAACSVIMVKINDPQKLAEVYNRLAERFPDNKMMLTRDLPALFAQGTPAMQVFLDTVVALSLMVSSILILLTMYSTVKEMTRQIGILKSMGASGQRIALEVVKQALALTFIGVLAGFLLSTLGKYVIEAFAPTSVILEPKWFLYVLILGLLSGAVGALYPAMRAASQDPVSALAYE